MSESQTLVKPTRQYIMGLEQAIRDELETFDPNELVEHHFAPNVYGREMFIPAGSVIVGKIHKHSHLNIIISGLIRVVTEFGEETIQGPRIWVSEPGTKRAVYAIEDTRWITIHPNHTDTKCLVELEDYVIAPSYEELGTLLLKGETQ